MDQIIREQHTGRSTLKYPRIGSGTDGKIKHPILLGSSKPAAVKQILPDGLFKVIQARNADKAPDLYSDLFASFFGGNCPLGGKVNLCPVFLKADQERVVGNRPAIFDQRLFDRLMINVLDHSLHYIAAGPTLHLPCSRGRHRGQHKP